MSTIIRIFKKTGESIDLIPDLTNKVSDSFTSNITNNPVQSSLSLPNSDNVSLNAPTLSLDLVFSDQTSPRNSEKTTYAYAMLLLEFAWLESLTCYVITKEFTRKNLKITSFNYTQNSNTGNRFDVSLSFQKIQIVKSKTAVVPSVKKIGKPKANASSKAVKNAQINAQKDRFTPKQNKGLAGGGSPSAKVTAKAKEVKKSYLASLADASGSFIKGLLP